MQNIQVHKIGREDVDIVINDSGVSRLHAELIDLTDGRYYLTDCDSVSGTFVYRNNEWEKLKQDFVQANEIINLGKSQYTAHALIAMSQKQNRGTSSKSDQGSLYKRKENDLPEGKVIRDPETGDILKDNK